MATAVYSSRSFSWLCFELQKKRRETDVALGLIFELQINIEIVLSELCDNNSYFFEHEHSLNITIFCTSLSISSPSLYPLPPLFLSLLLL